jgi:hypothetical protein
MTDLVPAVVHDLRNGLQRALSENRFMGRTLLAEGRTQEQLHRIVEGERENLEALSQLVFTLCDLFLMPQRDAVIRLRDLPGEIDRIWQVFTPRRHQGFAVLQQSERQIRLLPYRWTLTLALQAALISLRRDREPVLDIDFRVGDASLATHVRMRHYEQPETTTPQWRALRSAVSLAGGTLQIEHSGDATLLKWDVPLVDGV